MTKYNDFIRQASLFTMGGLIDPRLLTKHSERKMITTNMRKKTINTFDIVGKFRSTAKSRFIF